MEKSTDYCIVYVTCDSFDNARNISKIIVSEKIAACCTMVSNVLSVFEWDNAVEERTEFMLIIKTIKANLQLLEDRVVQLHKDKIPEIIAVDIAEGHGPYLQWIKSTTEQ